MFWLHGYDKAFHCQIWRCMGPFALMMQRLILRWVFESWACQCPWIPHLSTLEVEAGGSVVEGQPWSQIRCEATLGSPMSVSIITMMTWQWSWREGSYRGTEHRWSFLCLSSHSQIITQRLIIIILLIINVQPIAQVYYWIILTF